VRARERAAERPSPALESLDSGVARSDESRAGRESGAGTENWRSLKLSRKFAARVQRGSNCK
jgi:hypothetical protein